MVLGLFHMVRLRWHMRRRHQTGDATGLDTADLLASLGSPGEWPHAIVHLFKALTLQADGRKDQAFHWYGQVPHDGFPEGLADHSEVQRLLEHHGCIGSVLIAFAHRAHTLGGFNVVRLRWLARMQPVVFALLESHGRPVVPPAFLPVYVHHASEVAYGRPLHEAPSHAMDDFCQYGRVRCLPLLTNDQL